MYKRIKLELNEKLIGKSLTDAHRHGLYDIGKVENMENLSVEQWSRYDKFIDYQRKTKKLYDIELLNELKEWIEYSRNENLGVILDTSAKHASRDLKKIYQNYKIRNYHLIKWNKIEQINDKNIPHFIVLPDERLLSNKIISNIISISNRYPTIKFTMHCLESQNQKNVALKKFNMSTIEWLNKHNFLNERLFLVHINEVSRKDIYLIRQNNVNIILCPLMRKPLSYKNPEIPLDLNIYFGTDAPLISKNRSLIDAAIHQAIVWIKHGMNFNEVIEITSNALTKNI